MRGPCWSQTGPFTPRRWSFGRPLEILLPAFTACIALIVAIAIDPMFVDISGTADRTLCICS